MAICKSHGCSLVARSKGYCAKHYQRVERLGTAELPEKKKKLCLECGNEAYSKGLCKKHYKIKRYLEKKKEKSLIKERVGKSKFCCVLGCENALYLKGYCTKHYQRVKKYKSTIAKSAVYRSLLPRDRLLLKTIVNAQTECWEWQGYKNKGGYGVLSKDNLTYLCHIFSYEQFVGNIPEGLCVCHTCDNPGCVNPSHLFLATNEENSEDRNRKGRTLKGDKSPTATLTEKQVIRIKKMIEKGISNTHIGKKFGVTSWTISRIKCGKNWKHVVI